MNERIKKIRKALDLTQQEFAERIGMKRNSIAQIETGRKTSDQTIIAICREFNVNEAWLKTGAGEMFNPAPTDELGELIKKRGLTEHDRIAVEKFLNLRPEIREAMLDYFCQVAEELAEKQESETPEERARRRAEEIYQELLIEERQADIQSASTQEHGSGSDAANIA